MLGVGTESILSRRTRSDGPQEQRGEGGGQGRAWGMGHGMGMVMKGLV